MLRLNLTHQSRKFVGKLPPKQFRQVVNKVLELMANPEPPDSIHMQGYPFKRVDIGEYRIVYRVEGDCVNVACIGKRNDDEVYKQLKWKLTGTPAPPPLNKYFICSRPSSLVFPRNPQPATRFSPHLAKKPSF